MARSAKDRQHASLLRRQSLKVQQTLIREDHLKRQFIGSYLREYQRVSERAVRDIPSLLGIWECEDHVFYDMDGDERRAHVGYEHLQGVEHNTLDDIDLEKEMQGVGRTPDQVQFSGFMNVVTDGEIMSTMIFMRRDVGARTMHAESLAALRLPFLLHEIGHAYDFEQKINFKDMTVNVVGAEAYAHRYACDQMVGRGYGVALPYYLNALKASTKSDKEYVRRSAEAVVKSADFIRYESAAWR